MLGRQRVVLGLLDGLDPEYVRRTPMPVLRRFAREGHHGLVEGAFPTVTNVNNVSICCAAWPSDHGVSGNSYFDEERGAPAYMNAAEFIRAETIFQRAARAGVPTAILTCKRKTLELFGRSAAVAVAAENPPAEWVTRYGPPGNIYSFEINLWIWRAAADLLVTRPEIGLVYVHTTDYPMHRWAPDAPESQEHLVRLDALIGEARDAAPDAAFLLTADHGMNAKSRCWDLARVLRASGIEPRFVLSPERDYYPAHHRDLTGCAFLWLRAGDAPRAEERLSQLQGVEEVLEGREAAPRFRLPPGRTGDLVVLGDRETMFGELEGAEREDLRDYRAHGSLHESTVPLWIHGLEESGRSPVPRYNLDLARPLFE